MMNGRTRVLVIGGLVGGLVGVLAGQLYLRSVEEETEEEELPSLEPGDVIKLVLSVLGTLKLITGLAESA